MRAPPKLALPSTLYRGPLSPPPSLRPSLAELQRPRALRFRHPRPIALTLSRRRRYTAISKYVSEFEDPSETPAPTLVETLEEQSARRLVERDAAVAAKRDAKVDKGEVKVDFDPANDPKIKGDPYKASEA